MTRAATSPLPAWAPGNGARRARDFFFLLAIVLLNYTLFRPSPVDVSFTVALVLALVARQRITAGAFFFVTLILAWLCSLYLASFPYADDEDVMYQIWKISFATTIGLGACFAAVHWGGAALRRFLRVWIFSGVIAATLGILGFVGGIEDFTWDGRAKGLFDDPNMYAAFLIPAVLGCLHFLSLGEGRRWPYALSLPWLTLGILLSFSRVGIVAALLLSGLLVLVLNRRAMARVVVYGGLAIVVVAVIVGVTALFVDGFDDKVLDRFTLAKDYDLGEQGRLARYMGSLDFILSLPRGFGLLQYEKMFPEPIHNIWISSFLNYGWSGGFAFTLLVMFAIFLSLRNLRATRDPVCLTVLLAWLGILACALLHESERWRHLWLMTGLLWGLHPVNWGVRPVRPTPRPAPAAIAVPA